MKPDKIYNGRSTIHMYNCDCMDIIETLEFDIIITDPPYPDYYQKEFSYRKNIINWMGNYTCPQIVFWSAKESFPLNYTARHVWDKITGASCQYDFIYERNGGKRQNVFRGHRINSSVSANFANEYFCGHKSQKPLFLMRSLVTKYTTKNDVILDPYMGSASTAIACYEEERNCIGIELDENYFNVAVQRFENHISQTQLF